MTKVSLFVCTILGLLAIATTRVEAASANINCKVTGVLWQKYSTPTTNGGTSPVPTDILIIACSDGNGYGSYIGTSTQVALVPPATGAGCYASADAVKAFESLAVSAFLSGKTVSIWWTGHSCPGNAGQRSIDSVTLQ